MAATMSGANVVRFTASEPDGFPSRRFLQRLDQEAGNPAPAGRADKSGQCGFDALKVGHATPDIGELVPGHLAALPPAAIGCGSRVRLLRFT